MYNVVKLISYLIRQFILPNPFINIFKPGIAEIVNYAIGGMFILLAYKLTGTWYRGKKEDY